MQETTTPLATVVEAYLGMWNETDAAVRAQLIETAWVDTGYYQDPLLEAKGHDGLSAMVAGFHDQYPGYAFRQAGGIDAHHELARFGWELVAPDGSVFIAGIDVAAIAPDGRLARIAGFFGDLPAAAAAA